MIGVGERAVVVVHLADAFIDEADVPAPVLPEDGDSFDVSGSVRHPQASIGIVRALRVFRGALGTIEVQTESMTDHDITLEFNPLGI